MLFERWDVANENIEKSVITEKIIDYVKDYDEQ